MKPIELDGTNENADWTKKSWDLPDYKSKEFYELIPPEQLEWFRTTETYKAAVEAGLILDDEWLIDQVEEAPAPPPKKTADSLTIHLH